MNYPSLILPTIFSLLNFSYAQTNTFPPSGNVGIGTASPASLLSVGSTSQFQVNSSGAITAATGITTTGQIFSNTTAGGQGLKFWDQNDGAVIRINAPVNAGYFKQILIDQPNEQIALYNGNGDDNYGGGIARLAGGVTNIFANYPSAGGVSLSTAGVTRMFVSVSGNTGMGTTSPLDKLDITGTTSSNAGHIVFGDGGTYNPYIKSYKWTESATNYYQTAIGKSLGAAGAISFQTGNGGGVIGSDAQTTRMIITRQGNVGINTINTQGYTFAVNGTCVATAITVKTYTTWPDYVFQPSYQLTPLSKVEKYIGQNHHLPNVPSAKEIEQEGLNLGEMNKLLVKKVEELTLYLIDQNKRIEKLESQLKTMKNEK